MPPSEYGIDPTRIGRILGLVQMGEIKMQLAREVEREAKTSSTPIEPPPVENKVNASPVVGNTAVKVENKTPEILKTVENIPMVLKREEGWRDEITVVLIPGQGLEYKLAMKSNAQAQFHWTANGSILNYDLHGDGKGQSISYKKGRGVLEDEGTVKAAFDGYHGWFWRNRTYQDVTLTLRAKGNYSKLKRMI